MDFTLYHTGELVDGVYSKSYNVCSRLSEASGIPLYNVRDFTLNHNTIPVFYGAMRGTDRIMSLCKWASRSYIYVDNGYIGAGHYDGYYRFCVNEQFSFDWRHDGQKRLDALGLTLQPFVDKTVETVVICKPSFLGCHFYPHYKVVPEEWTEGVAHTLRRAGFQVIISAKTGDAPKLRNMSPDTYDAVIAHDSGTLFDAMIAGKRFCSVTLQSGTTEQAVHEFNNFSVRDWNAARRKHLLFAANNQFKLSEVTTEVLEAIVNDRC